MGNIINSGDNTLLEETRTLEKAVDYIKSINNYFPNDVVDNYISFVAKLFDREYDEIEGLVYGNQ